MSDDEVKITPLPEAGDPALAPRAMTSAAEVARLVAALQGVVARCFRDEIDFAPAGAAARAARAIADARVVYERRPLRDNRGGSGCNDSLWLFTIAQAFEPRLIVESGTFKGHSAWLFRQACPEAEIHSFDVDAGRRACDAPGVCYHEADWSAADWSGKETGRALLFLDDHISHARRLREAQARGFRLLLVDDNFAAHQLHATGGPPLPTLAMILDPEPGPARELAWTRGGKAYAWHYRPAELAPLRALVARAVTLPELAPITRQPPGSALTLVKLVD